MTVCSDIICPRTLRVHAPLLGTPKTSPVLYTVGLVFILSKEITLSGRQGDGFQTEISVTISCNYMNITIDSLTNEVYYLVIHVPHKWQK